MSTERGVRDPQGWAWVRWAALCIHRLYRVEPAGGRLHVIVDDGNVEDHWIDEEMANDRSGWLPEEERTLVALTKLDEEQRRCAIHLAKNVWRPLGSSEEEYVHSLPCPDEPGASWFKPG